MLSVNEQLGITPLRQPNQHTYIYNTRKMTNYEREASNTIRAAAVTTWHRVAYGGGAERNAHNFFDPFKPWSPRP